MSTEREQVEALAWASARLAALEAIREGDRVREPNNQSIIDTPYWRGYQSALHDLSQIDPGTLDPTHGLPGVDWLAEVKAAARAEAREQIAQAIEAERKQWSGSTLGGSARRNAFASAARIARGTP